MIDKVNDEFIVDCTNNSKEERQQVYKFLVDNRNYDKGYLGNDFSIIVCNKEQGNTNWNVLLDAENSNGKSYNVYTFEQFKEMYLEEEFVLPEKWCVKVTDKTHKTISENSYRIFPNYETYITSMLLSSKSWNSWDLNRDAIKEGYTEITFKQFLKYILKQETMKKEIIGYKLVKSEYKGAYEEITGTSNLDRIEDSLGKLNWVDKAIKDLKEAGVLELWFKPNYKEEKTIVKMYSSNKGEFEIEVVGKKAYYRPEHKELSLQFIKNILNLFENKTIGLEYSIEVDSLKVGCMEGTRKSDWQKVYDLIK